MIIDLSLILNLVLVSGKVPILVHLNQNALMPHDESRKGIW